MATEQPQPKRAKKTADLTFYKMLLETYHDRGILDATSEQNKGKTLPSLFQEHIQEGFSQW